MKSHIITIPIACKGSYIKKGGRVEKIIDYVKNMDFEIIEDNSLKHIIDVTNPEKTTRIEVLKSEDHKIYYPLDGSYHLHFSKGIKEGITLEDLQNQCLNNLTRVHDFNCHLLDKLCSAIRNIGLIIVTHLSHPTSKSL